MLCRLVAAISLLCLVVGCESNTQPRVVERAVEQTTTSSNEWMACGKPWFKQVGSNGDTVEIEWGCPVTNKMDIIRNMTVRGLLEDTAGNIVVDSMATGFIDPGKTVIIKRNVTLTKAQAARVVGIGIQANNQ